jgi:hypothetical protein
MDIEYANSEHRGHTVFDSVNLFPISELYQQQITLESTFA